MLGTALDHYDDYDDWGDASDVKKKGKDRYFEEEKKTETIKAFYLFMLGNKTS